MLVEVRITWPNFSRVSIAPLVVTKTMILGKSLHFLCFQFLMCKVEANKAPASQGCFDFWSNAFHVCALGVCLSLLLLKVSVITVVVFVASHARRCSDVE